MDGSACTGCRAHQPISHKKSRSPRELLATTPGVLLLILTPKCPACLMAYGGVLAMTGVSRFITGPGVILLATLSLLLVAAFAIWRKSIVFALAGIASIALVWTSRQLDAPWAMWIGVTILALAYAWEIARPYVLLKTRFAA